MSTVMDPAMNGLMPRHPIRWESWQLNKAADRRFFLICLQIAVPLLAFAIATALQEFRREEPPVLEAPPPRQYAKLLPPPPVVRKPKPPPIPPPKEVEPEPEPEPEPVEKAPRAAVPKAQPRVVPKPVPRIEPRFEPRPEPQIQPAPVPVPVIQPKPQPTQEQLTAQARQRAANSMGAFSDDLASLRNSKTADRVATGAAVITGTGAPAKQSSGAPSNLTNSAGGSSGGIDTGSLSRDTGAVALSGRSTEAVTAATGSVGAKAIAGKSSGSRGREAIEEVFDQNKGAIYALYNRALRDNPTLQGKLVLRLTIEPDGTVSACEVVSSELNEPQLEARLVERVKLFRFEAADVGTVTITKPITFFPTG